ncbi:hypothetical protein P7C71_g3315, partial [Lecanoromycetidae sp. Uapishka_2]
MDCAAQILVLLEGVAILESFDEDPGKVLTTALDQFRAFSSFYTAAQMGLMAARNSCLDALGLYTTALKSNTACRNQLIAEKIGCDRYIRHLETLAKALTMVKPLRRDVGIWVAKKQNFDVEVRRWEGMKASFQDLEAKLKLADENMAARKRDLLDLWKAKDIKSKELTGLDTQREEIVAKLRGTKTKAKAIKAMISETLKLELDEGVFDRLQSLLEHGE